MWRWVPEKCYAISKYELNRELTIADTKPVPVVIFDFDGTLADSFVASVRIFEKLTRKSEPYTEEDILRLRGLNAYHLMRELKIRPWRVPWLLVRGRAMMRRHMSTIVVFKGMEEVLQQLHDAGAPMYIMSSNSPGNIRRLMRDKGLDHYFAHIYGNIGLFGKAKRLRQIIHRNRLEVGQVFYIGDEGRDVEAAKRVGVKSVAVTWGFNSAELLAQHHPYALVNTASELAHVLKSGFEQ